MSKNVCTNEMPDSFFDPQKIFKNLTSALEISNKLNKGFAVANKLSGLYTAITEYQSVSKKICSNHSLENILKNATTIQSVLAKVQIPTTVNLATKFDKTLLITNKNYEFLSIDWDWISEKLDTYDETNYENVSDVLTDDVCGELNESVQEILHSNDCDKLTKSKFLEFQNRHPVISFILIQILLSILINLFSGVVGNWLSGITTKKTNAYEEPSSTSNVVVNIDIDQKVTIVDEVPYYFEVIFTHPETGEEMKGYIYKHNISMPQESNRTEDVTTANSDTQ